jgi:hypothetical protein
MVRKKSDYYKWFFFQINEVHYSFVHIMLLPLTWTKYIILPPVIHKRHKFVKNHNNPFLNISQMNINDHAINPSTFLTIQDNLIWF